MSARSGPHGRRRDPSDSVRPPAQLRRSDLRGCSSLPGTCTRLPGLRATYAHTVHGPRSLAGSGGAAGDASESGAAATARQRQGPANLDILSWIGPVGPGWGPGAAPGPPPSGRARYRAVGRTSLAWPPRIRVVLIRVGRLRVGPLTGAAPLLRAAHPRDPAAPASPRVRRVGGGLGGGGLVRHVLSCRRRLAALCRRLRLRRGRGERRGV